MGPASRLRSRLCSLALVSALLPGSAAALDMVVGDVTITDLTSYGFTDVTSELGYDYLKDFINYGSPGGMPNWGTSGDMTEKDVDMMAAYLLHEPPTPPEYPSREAPSPTTSSSS